MLAPLVALEDVGRETAVPRLPHQQRDRPDTRVERAGPMTVAVARPFLRAFVPLGAQRVRHLRFQYLVQYRLHQFRQSIRAAQQTRQQFLAYANINRSHRFSFFG